MGEKSQVYTKRSDGTSSSLLDRPSETDRFLSDVGFPGSEPFTRGIRPTMYRGRYWTMRQYAGFGSAEETNLRFRHLLEQGQTGLSVAFDLPTQMGYDADHEMARGEVGRVGVSISTLEDMEALFAEIPLDRVSTSMTINSTAAILLSFYLAVAKKNGASVKKLRGTIQNDILKEYIARGTFIYPPSPSMRIVTDLIAYCATDLPGWNPISISGYHIREAGSDAVQEVAFTLANACAYAQNAIDRGLSFDAFAGQLSFFFAAHNDVIEEVAKFRAARRLWTRLATKRFRAKKDSSKLLRFHVQTAGSTLTAQQPNNNIVRVTLQAIAAVLGGCQSLHTNSRDEALALPSQESATLALRTQQIIAEESGMANTVDPCAGSYTIEKETDRIEAAAQSLIDDVDELGGSVTAVEKGYFQNAIAERAYGYQREIETADRRIVGLNVYTDSTPVSPPLLRVDEKLEANRRKRLATFKKRRREVLVKKALKELLTEAQSDHNLIPAILHAVESNATLGEISDTLRTEFGTYQPTDVIT